MLLTGLCSTTCAGVKDKSDNESGNVSRWPAVVSRVDVPIETQNFSENEDEDHADEDPRLAHERAHASVSHDSNRVACSQT